ncbi:MAG: hypothetical protein V4642_12115 [Bacteroidota bacterium]
MKQLLSFLIALMSLYAHCLYAQEVLKVTHPNGGEILVAGADTTIRWEGVSPQDTVDLHYSTDGNNWTLITREATGLACKWRVPVMQGDTFLLRAQLLKERQRRKNLEWYQLMKDTSSLYGSYPAMAFDSTGNIYVVGGFKNFIDFGNGIKIESSEEYDGFLAKFDSAGKPLWAKAIGGKRKPDNQLILEFATAVAIDRGGNILLAGRFQDSISFGSGINLNGAEFNLYLAKFDPEGNIKWATNVCDHPTWGFKKEYLAVTSGGDVILAGGFFGQSGPQNRKIAFGNGDTLLESGGNSDIYLAKFKSEGGELEWIRQASGGLSDDQVSAIELDGDDNIYASGNFQDSINLNGGIELKGDWYSGFVAKFSSEGNTQWAHAIYSGVWTHGLALAESGNIYVCGESGSKVNFGDVIKDSSYSWSGFIAKYNNNGKIQWARMLPGDSGDGVEDIAVDSDENVFVTGRYDWWGGFGGGITLPDNNPNLYTAKYNSSGQILWARPYGGAQQLICRPADGAGTNVYAVGMYGDWLPLSETVTLHPDSIGGIFLAKYFYNDTPDAEDISDEIWSADKPELTVQDIDFGRVRVRTGRDTTLTAAIRNTGKYPMRVDYISLRGRHYEEFNILSSLEPFVLLPGGEKRVRVWFVPQGTGLRTATLDLSTQIGSIRLRLRGEGWDTVTNVNEYPDLKDSESIRPVYLATGNISSIVFKTNVAAQVQITLTNIDGRQNELFSGYCHGGSHSISFASEHLPSGFYILSMNSNGKSVAVPCMISK